VYPSRRQLPDADSFVVYRVPEVGDESERLCLWSGKLSAIAGREQDEATRLAFNLDELSECMATATVKPRHWFVRYAEGGLEIAERLAAALPSPTVLKPIIGGKDPDRLYVFCMPQGIMSVFRSRRSLSAIAGHEQEAAQGIVEAMQSAVARRKAERAVA